MTRRQSLIRHRTNERRAICILSFLCAAAFCLMNIQAAAADVPIGWAAVSGKGVESTTGGGDDKVVMARTAEELADYAKRSEPLTILINSGTSKPDDIGHLNTTIDHCWFNGCDTRNPRAGYGKVHVFNCLYNGNNYGIGLHSQCLVLAERNFFHRTKDPINQMYRPDPKDIHHGFCESVGNIFKDCSGAQDDEGKSFPVNDYFLYDSVLDNAADVPEIVKAKAGPAAEFGKLGPLPVPGNGAVNVSIKPVLRWTKGHEARSYKVAFGEKNPLSKTVERSEQTFDPGTLKGHTVYYWRVDQITNSGVITGDVWQFRTRKAGSATD